MIEEIIFHAMERDPKRRNQSAAAMKKELDDYESVEMTNRHTRLQAPQVWKSRIRMVPMIAIFVVVQGLIFLLLFWCFHQPHRK